MVNTPSTKMVGSVVHSIGVSSSGLVAAKPIAMSALDRAEMKRLDRPTASLTVALAPGLQHQPPRGERAQERLADLGGALRFVAFVLCGVVRVGHRCSSPCRGAFTRR